MILTPQKGRYVARFAQSAADLLAAQRLRHLCFVERAGVTPRAGGIEADRFDALCRHVLIEEQATGRLVACFRILTFRDGAGIGQSYAAQYYDLAALAGFAGPMVELGRFCIDADVEGADVLRVAWAALTRHVDAHHVELLFGCSSFPGMDSNLYRDAFALLAADHLAPGHLRPAVKSSQVIRFATLPGRACLDRKSALRGLPPLLRSYLAMGGWVSDHAVMDRDLNTLHVFTALEIRAIPPARARALRAIAVEAEFAVAHQFHGEPDSGP